MFIDENESHFCTCKLRHNVSFSCLHYEKNWTQCSVFDFKKNIPDCMQLYDIELGGNLTFSFVKRYQLRA